MINHNVSLITILIDWIKQDEFLNTHFEAFSHPTYYTKDRPIIGIIRMKCWGGDDWAKPVVARTSENKLILSKGIHVPSVMESGDPEFFDKLAKELYSRHNMVACKWSH